MPDTGRFAMAVRRVTTSSRSIIGSFPSLKNGQPVSYQSTIERDLLYFLEYDTTVCCYTMQPFVIKGTDAEGVPHTYTPDILVERTTRRTVVECKPAAKRDHPHTQQQVALGQAWADANGCDFVLITDADLRTGHRLANLKLLWRYARLAVPQAVTDRCLRVLTREPAGIPFHALISALDGVAPSLNLAPCLYALLFQHVLKTDLDHPLTSTSLLTHIGAPLRA
ncbi:TnsA endonuclease N-terminal domain-containing protein [Candidatus Oscillochloris fontis]|uniref:TnsA endonuclease N-terminal domain-containing protein n=1 Tax=Candidatus Oscillochloris fontis TaxID=2496868 RepID=UPI001291FE49